MPKRPAGGYVPKKTDATVAGATPAKLATNADDAEADSEEYIKALRSVALESKTAAETTTTTAAPATTTAPVDTTTKKKKPRSDRQLTMDDDTDDFFSDEDG